MAVAPLGHQLIIWVPLVGMLLVGFLTSLRCAGRRFSFCLHRKIGRYPCKTGWIHALYLDFILDLSIGEFLFCLVVVGMTWLRWAMFYVDFPSWSLGYRQSLVDARVFRSFGEVNFFFLAFIIFPVAQNSLFTLLLGISWERAVKFHRVWGRLLLINMAVHGFGMWGSFSTAPRPPATKDFNFVFRMLINPETNWSNLSGLLAFLCFLGMATFALPWIRRNRFEVFYFGHISLAPVGYVFAYLHMPALIGFFAPALFLLAVDLFFRARNAWFYQYEVVDLTPLPGNVTRVEVRKTASKCCGRFFAETRLSFEPGQFCLVRMPAISGIQAHPFSISAAPGEATFTFHMKDMGPGTFTNAVNTLATSKKSAMPRIFIDGPYGHPAVPLHRYETLVLVCGGVGVTPCASLLEHALRSHRQRATRRVVFSWTVQDTSLLKWFLPLLREAHRTTRGGGSYVDTTLSGSRENRSSSQWSYSEQQEETSGGGRSSATRPGTQDGLRVDLHLHVTRGTKEDGHDVEGLPITYGRPDYRALLAGACAGAKSGVAVFACGPGPLVDDVQRTAHDFSAIDFHKELFLL